jgi:hypothetical protein
MLSSTEVAVRRGVQLIASPSKVYILNPPERKTKKIKNHFHSLELQTEWQLQRSIYVR